MVARLEGGGKLKVIKCKDRLRWEDKQEISSARARERMYAREVTKVPLVVAVISDAEERRSVEVKREGMLIRDDCSAEA